MWSRRYMSVYLCLGFIFWACTGSGLKTKKIKSAPSDGSVENVEEKVMTKSESENAGAGDTDLKGRLTPLQYEVTQQCGTERPFTGKYWDTKTAGVYHCVVCDAPLFTSETKYDSGSGWPSFWEPVSEGSIRYKEDHSLMLGMRIEAQCAKCGAHLGHVFDDGPQPSGQRYCINSASLDLEEVEE